MSNTENLNDCPFFYLEYCLYGEGATFERMENSKGVPIGYRLLEGRYCEFDKCPYKNKLTVGDNIQNMKTTK